MKSVEECLKHGRLKKAVLSRDMIRKELDIGKEDLKEAEAGLIREAYKWSTIQGYYGTFHAMRALLFAAGYREESHAALKIGINELYVIPGKLTDGAYRALERGMELRELADYKASFSAETARWLVSQGQAAITEVEQILDSMM